MAIPTLIYCANGNKRLAQIAIDAGYLYGAQLPGTIYHQPYFVDQDWKHPNREKYMEALNNYRPYMASVMDWEQAQQLPEVLEWAEDAARFVEVVMIIPKVQGGVPYLPKIVGGKPIRLGYSIPSNYGGTGLSYSDFIGWPVHLLGGSPHKQMRLTAFLDVSSADGNYAAKMSHRCQFWIINKGANGHWARLLDTDGQKWPEDAIYEAFRRSCVNIMAAWHNLGKDIFGIGRLG